MSTTATTSTSHRPPPKPLDLELTIISAKHLKNVNWRTGDLHPYAIFWLDPERRLATKSDDSNSTKPVWNERHVIPIPPSPAATILTIEIFHSKPSDTPKPLVGTLRLPIDELPNPDDSNLVRVFDLRRPSGRPCGKIRLKLAIKDRPVQDYQGYYYPSPVPPSYGRYPPPQTPIPSFAPPTPRPYQYDPYPGYYQGGYYSLAPRPVTGDAGAGALGGLGPSPPSAPVDYAQYEHKQKPGSAPADYAHAQYEHKQKLGNVPVDYAHIEDRQKLGSASVDYAHAQYEHNQPVRHLASAHTEHEHNQQAHRLAFDYAQYEHNQKLGSTPVDYAHIEHKQKLGSAPVDYAHIEHKQKLGSTSVDYVHAQYEQKLGSTSVDYAHAQYEQKPGNAPVDYAHAQYEQKHKIGKVGSVSGPGLGMEGGVAGLGIDEGLRYHDEKVGERVEGDLNGRELDDYSGYRRVDY